MVDEVDIWRALDAVKDPEIPVVSLVELGIVRGVQIADDHVSITLTPTFSGCPALDAMREMVEEQLHALGIEQVDVRFTLAPPWTTDSISEAGREKLKSFGIAPPRPHGGQIDMVLLEEAECPYCGSKNTELRSTFGPTSCRMMYYCHNCQQPFEQFKPL
jgi:ring-1,2-phenylacetyl-CoA epoxidase subunit PaaD